MLFGLRSLLREGTMLKVACLMSGNAASSATILAAVGVVAVLDGNFVPLILNLPTPLILNTPRCGIL